MFFYLIVLALVAWWVLDHTPPGRYIYATGGNPEAARLSGVKVGMWVWLSFVASGFVCGIAGVLYASQNGPSLTFGAALLLPAYAAAFLGSTQLKPGRFNVWGTIIAVYVLAVGRQGALARHQRAVAQRRCSTASRCWPRWPSRAGSSGGPRPVAGTGEHARPEVPPTESPPPLEGQPPLESPSPAVARPVGDRRAHWPTRDGRRRRWCAPDSTGTAASTPATGSPGKSPQGAPRPCIFACNDVMAIGVAAALREHGLEVPRDAALAGFDDIEWLRDFRPALSTVGLPLEELGRLVTLGAISGDAGPSAVEGAVVLRHSTSTGYRTGRRLGRSRPLGEPAQEGCVADQLVRAVSRDEFKHQVHLAPVFPQQRRPRRARARRVPPAQAARLPATRRSSGFP